MKQPQEAFKWGRENEVGISTVSDEIGRREKREAAGRKWLVIVQILDWPKLFGFEQRHVDQVQQGMSMKNVQNSVCSGDESAF